MSLPEFSVTVINDLLAEMDRRVNAYDENAKRICGCIDGTAFFPGGMGLWRGLIAHDPAPAYFPVEPIMFLGHNFDNEVGFRRSENCGIELMDVRTWKGQRTYMEMACIDPLDCFFTNFYTALQPGSSTGELLASDALKNQCVSFCEYQIERTDPCLVIVLGRYVPPLFARVRHAVPFIEIDHPAYPVRLGTERGKKVYADNVRELKKVLKVVGYYERKKITC